MTGHIRGLWSNEAAVERFRELVSDRIPYSRIAGIMYEEFHYHLTRNACIGKAHRLGLWNGRNAHRITEIRAHRQTREERAASQPREHRLTEIAMAKKVRPPLPMPISVILDALPSADYPHRCSILGLTNETCRWPLGGARAKAEFYCGDPTADLAEKKPYCRGHDAIAHFRY